MINSLITIGITCYNEGDWLLECWESVLQQTDDRWEAVLVMDGTEHERTKEIFAQLAHPKLTKIALQENIGPYPARNVAFKYTTTKYHLYLDADDHLLPNSVKLILDTFERNPNASIVYGDLEIFGTEKSILQRLPKNVEPYNLIEGQCMPGSSAYTKEVWNVLGGFNESLARGNGDYEFHIGAMEAGFKAYHCGDIYYRYRLGHAGKISNSYSLKYHETHKIIWKLHPEFFNNRHFSNRFLGLGYRRAAKANLNAKKRLKAFSLACFALYYGMWKDLNVWSIIIKVVLPKYIYNFLHKQYRT